MILFHGTIDIVSFLQASFFFILFYFIFLTKIYLDLCIPKCRTWIVLIRSLSSQTLLEVGLFLKKTCQRQPLRHVHLLQNQLWREVSEKLHLRLRHVGYLTTPMPLLLLTVSWWIFFYFWINCTSEPIYQINSAQGIFMWASGRFLLVCCVNNLSIKNWFCTLYQHHHQDRKWNQGFLLHEQVHRRYISIQYSLNVALGYFEMMLS